VHEFQILPFIIFRIQKGANKMPVSSVANQAVQTLTAQWYNAICTGCNLDPTTFQLVQAAIPLQPNATGTTQIWQIFNAIPPYSINQYFNASQGNLFAQDYFAVLNSLASPPQATSFQNVLGANLSSWTTYIANHMPSPYTPGGYCEIFQTWAMTNLPPSTAQQAITACTQWQFNEITQAQQMQEALEMGQNGLNANVTAFTTTITDIQKALASAPSRSCSMASQTASSDTSNSWAQGSVSGGFDFFYGSGNTTYDDFTTALASAGVNLAVSFKKLIAVPAGPLAEPQPKAPILSQYVPWYNSAALGLAFNNQADWESNSQFTWADAFGPSGDLLRLNTEVIIVDGINLTMTSSASVASGLQQSFQAAASGGCFPFFQANGSGGWSTNATFESSGGVSVTSQCAPGNPNILGVSVTPIGQYLGGN
jgi:hypothetical protein